MNELFGNLNEKTQQLFSPISKVNELILSNLKEIVEIQSQALSNYAEIGINQTKAAMEIRDTDSFTAFVNQQKEIAETAQAQFKGDLEKMTELANKFSKEVSGAFKESDQPKASSEPTA